MGQKDPLEVWIEKALNYQFKNQVLVQRALTHASGGYGKNDYETLEFLGDRALGLIISQHLLNKFPDSNEGDLARRHTALVRKQALVKVAIRLGLSDHIRLSKGEKLQGTHQQETIMADVMEALIGAVFTDGGYDACVAVVIPIWAPLIEVLGDDVPQDAKTRLQEWSQGQGYPLPQYEIDRIKGPAHAPEVWVRIKIEGIAQTSACGPNRKEATQKGAQMLCDKLIKEDV